MHCPGLAERPWSRSSRPLPRFGILPAAARLRHCLAPRWRSKPFRGHSEANRLPARRFAHRASLKRARATLCRNSVSASLLDRLAGEEEYLASAHSRDESRDWFGEACRNFESAGPRRPIKRPPTQIRWLQKISAGGGPTAMASRSVHAPAGEPAAMPTRLERPERHRTKERPHWKR